MPVDDPRLCSATADANLTALALLYANGELEGSDSAAFERRLAEEQMVRDALCQAVQLTQMLGGCQPERPNATYRERVRQQLASTSGTAREGWWRRLLRPAPYRGHPAAWLATGALAATVLILCGQPLFDGPDDPPANAPPVRPVVVSEPVPTAAPAHEFSGETARVWADLHTSDHLIRVRAEEARRKTRFINRGLARTDTPRAVLRNP